MPIDPHDFEAMTSERPAPESSRSHGDPFTHLIEERATRKLVLRFWMPGKPPAECPLDYEILDERLDDATARTLVMKCFFQVLTGDFYADKVTTVSFARLDGTQAVTQPYPRS